MRARFNDWGIVALMALGSLALWTVIPTAWLWLTRNMESGVRFLVTVPGCVISMLVAGAEGLKAVEKRAGRSDTGAAPPGRSSWLDSVGEARGAQRSLSLLDSFLVASAVVALLALVGWWVFLADSSNPSGPLQPL